MKYRLEHQILPGRHVWVIELENNFSSHHTLLLSKVSEAILPNTKGNHIGAGASLDEFLQHQKGVRFVINGGYNHYRKDFYAWSHDKFNVGDPVGVVKIREHYFEDALGIENFGFFIQKSKGEPWRIVKHPDLLKTEKYILGCTPLLIYEGKKTSLPLEHMIPIPQGVINPPSVLGHGLQNHPRTAVGIKNNSIIFLIVEGKKQEGDIDGCTLPELQSLGETLNLDSLLNLDGGGSSQFRLYDNKWISNYVCDSDKDRVLGNIIVLFESQLKLKN